MGMPTKGMHFSPPDPEPEYAPALKELANRLKRLSFREMSQFSGMIEDQGGNLLTLTTAECLLQVADKIEGVV